jgi:AraC-like DNA-binding protein
MAGELQTRFPNIAVEPDTLYIDQGSIATSVGTAAGIDLCLHLVRTDHGAAYAAQIARHMVMPPQREGGQLQYAAAARTERPPGSLAPLLDWAIERLHEPLTVDDFAKFAKVSARTLARRFADQLDVSPGRWLLNQRIAAAQALLEETDLPIEAVADKAGLSSATNLRRRFRGVKFQSRMWGTSWASLRANVDKLKPRSHRQRVDQGFLLGDLFFGGREGVAVLGRLQAVPAVPGRARLHLLRVAVRRAAQMVRHPGRRRPVHLGRRGGYEAERIGRPSRNGQLRYPR